MITHESSVKQSVLDEISAPKATFTNLTTEKINLSTPEVGIGQPSAASIGNNTIAAGETEILVETTAVTDKSKVFVTATTTTRGQSIYVSEQTGDEGFTVKLDQPLTTDVKFNWWVVQVAAANSP